MSWTYSYLPTIVNPETGQPIESREHVQYAQTHFLEVRQDMICTLKKLVSETGSE